MRRGVLFAVGVFLIAAIWQLSPGFAAGLSSSSSSVASGKATVSRCDTDGVQSIFNFSPTTPFPVASVTVAGLSSACGSRTLNVTVNNGTTSQSGSATIPGGGGAVTVTLANTITWGDSMRTDLAVS